MAGGGGAGSRRTLLAGAAGAAACGLFWLAFPGRSLSTISHGLLRLPGPGSAVAVVYGPFIALTCLLAAELLRSDWAASAAGAAFALLHGACTPLALGEVKTVGTVGPWPRRVLAVLLAVAALQVVLLAMRKRSVVLRHLVPAAAADLALMGFYWAAIYPAAEGETVRPAGALVLIAAGTAAAAVGGLLPALLSRYCRREENTG